MARGTAIVRQARRCLSSRAGQWMYTGSVVAPQVLDRDLIYINRQLVESPFNFEDMSQANRPKTVKSDKYPSRLVLQLLPWARKVNGAASRSNTDALSGPQRTGALIARTARIIRSMWTQSPPREKSKLMQARNILLPSYEGHTVSLPVAGVSRPARPTRSHYRCCYSPIDSVIHGVCHGPR